MRVDKAMSTENLRMVTAMRTTIALIFCAQDKAMCTENLEPLSKAMGTSTVLANRHIHINWVLL